MPTYKPLISTAYLPTVRYMSVLAKYGAATIEQYENAAAAALADVENALSSKPEDETDATE